MSIQMHKIHCERNTVKCPKCGAKLNKFELEAHQTEVHTLKKCETCSQNIENQFFSAHDCPKKPVFCEYCEVTLPKDQIGTHRIECGNRTERCDRCQDYIKKKDFAKHVKDRSCQDYHEKLRQAKEKKALEEQKEAENQAKILREIERRQKIEKEIQEHQARQKIEREVQESQARPKKPQQILRVNEEKPRPREEEKLRNPREKPKNSETKPAPAGNLKVQPEKKESIPRAKPQTFNASMKKGNKSQSDAGRISKTGAQAKKDFNPKTSPKLIGKPVIRQEREVNEIDQFEIPDEIPAEFEDNFFDQKQPRRFSPNPATESQNFDEYDRKILEQVIAESKKDSGYADFDEDQELNQAIYESLKRK